MKKISIVIADDNVNLLNNMANYFEKEQEFEVIGLAKDGKEALDMVREKIPDILITDVEMPILDGVEVAKKIKEEKINSEIFIITGKMEKIITECRKLNISNIYSKPVRNELLAKNIIETINFNKPQIVRTIVKKEFNLRERIVSFLTK